MFNEYIGTYKEHGPVSYKELALVNIIPSFHILNNMSSLYPSLLQVMHAIDVAKLVTVTLDSLGLQRNKSNRENVTHFCDVITDASKLQVCIFGRLCHSAIIENIISCYAFSTKKAFYCKDRTLWMHYIDQELLQSEHIKAISQSIVICTLTALSLMAVVYADPCVTYWKAKIYYFPDTHQKESI